METKGKGEREGRRGPGTKKCIWKRKIKLLHKKEKDKIARGKKILQERRRPRRSPAAYWLERKGGRLMIPYGNQDRRFTMARAA